MRAILPSFPAPPGGRLTPEMTRAFREDGVIVLRDFVSREACSRLRDRARQLMDAFDPAEVASIFSTTNRTHQADRYFLESGDKIRFFFEQSAFDDRGTLLAPREDSINKIGHAMHELDPVFRRFSYSADIVQIARELGGTDPALLQSMYIVKPPRIGGEVHWHQDSTYLYTEPESCLGLWFALEDATLENGCLHFVPGGHHGPLRERNSRVEGKGTVTSVIDETPWPEDRSIPAPAQVGTLVVFHGRVPHMSGPNESDRSRHAYTLHVIDRACHYPESNWLRRGPDLPLEGIFST
jgi:phytanoyl-CoA hydroxylase